MIQQKAQAALGAPLHPSVPALMEEAGLTREEAQVLSALQTAWWTYHLQIVPYVDELQAMERTAFENQVRGKWGSGEGRIYWDTYIKHAAHPDAVRYIGELLARQTGDRFSQNQGLLRANQIGWNRRWCG